MSRNRTYWGWLATLLYLGVVIGAFVGWYQDREPLGEPIGPNEWGGFLVGVAAPVAFLWFVLGSYQQGFELRQNVEVLKRQADLLEAELRYQRAGTPSLVPFFLRGWELTDKATDLSRVFVVSNSGGDARNVVVCARTIHADVNIEAEAVVGSGDEITITVSAQGQKLLRLPVEFHLRFDDVTGKSYEAECEITKDGWYLLVHQMLLSADRWNGPPPD
jgi:hypothetical protein